MGLYIQVKGAILAIELLDHVADYLIVRSFHGLALVWPGAVRSQAGRELVVALFQILLHDVVPLIQLIFFNLVQSQFKLL